MGTGRRLPVAVAADTLPTVAQARYADLSAVRCQVPAQNRGDMRLMVTTGVLVACMAATGCSEKSPPTSPAATSPVTSPTRIPSQTKTAEQPAKTRSQPIASPTGNGKSNVPTACAAFKAIVADFTKTDETSAVAPPATQSYSP